MRRHPLRGKKGLRGQWMEGKDRQPHMRHDGNGDSAILFGTEKVSSDLENSNLGGGGRERQTPPPAASGNP